MTTTPGDPHTIGLAPALPRMGPGEPPTGLEVVSGLICLVVLMVLGILVLGWMPQSDDERTRVVVYEAGSALLGAIAYLGIALPLLVTRRRHAWDAMSFRHAPLTSYALWVPAGTLLPLALSHAVLVAASAFGFEAGPIAHSLLYGSVQILGFFPSFLIDAVIAGTTVAIAYFGVLLPWLRRWMPLTACALLLALFDGTWVGYEGHVGGVVFWVTGTMLQAFAWGRTGSLWVPIAMNIALASVEVALAWLDVISM